MRIPYMRSWIVFSVLIVLVLSTVAFAEQAKEGKASGPCQQIRKACEDAGFVKGEAKKGYGLWVDCIDPIMQGNASVPGATKALPTVDPNVVAACRAKNPKFGSGKVATK
jgi:hypothetical protein